MTEKKVFSIDAIDLVNRKPFYSPKTPTWDEVFPAFGKEQSQVTDSLCFVDGSVLTKLIKADLPAIKKSIICVDDLHVLNSEIFLSSRKEEYKKQEKSTQMKLTYGGTNLKIFRCKYCSRSNFVSGQSLGGHISREHKKVRGGNPSETIIKPDAHLKFEIQIEVNFTQAETESKEASQGAKNYLSLKRSRESE